ncbi:MAG: solute:sodium symporter family transporter [Hespellia sp.]|nr:solute:sodium symporter family transporter [Hespellia sp.]
MTIVLIMFLACTIAVGAIAWLKTRNAKKDTSDGYFLAGRGLSWIVIGTSMLLACLSTEQLSGQSGQVFMGNMTGAVAWENGCIIAISIMALVFAPRYLKFGVSTMPEYLGKIYDRQTQLIVSTLLIIGYIATLLPTVLYSGAVVFNEIFDVAGLLGVSDSVAVTIVGAAIGIIGLCYTVFGGLRMVAFSDTINGVLLLCGCVTVPFFGLATLGKGNIIQGFSTLLEKVPAEKFNAIGAVNAQAPEFPFPTLFLGVAVFWLFYWCTSQVIIQKTFAAKSLAEAQKGILTCAAFKLPGPWYIGFTGLLSFAIFKGTDMFERIAARNGDIAYAALIKEVIPTPVLGIVAAAVFGAVLSSFNGALNSCTTMFSLDIYKQWIQKDADDEKLVKVGRIFGFILALLSIIIAPFIIYAPTGLYDLMMNIFNFLNVPILAIMLFALFSKKVPPIAAKVAIVQHIILYAICMKVVPPSIHYMYVSGACFWINMLVIFVITKISPRKEPMYDGSDNVVDITPWKYAKVMVAVLLCCVVVSFVIFSPLVLAKVR